jgi:hypothetical protein
MRKNSTFFKCLVCLTLSVVSAGVTKSHAQSTLGTQLLGSSGGTSYAGGMGLSFSLGETYVEHTSQATFGLLQYDPLGLPTVQVSDKELITINLFPNPNDGNFQLSGVPVNVTHWQIFDLNGRLLASSRYNAVHIELGNSVAQGLYLIRLLNDQGGVIADRKFSIQY